MEGWFGGVVPVCCPVPGMRWMQIEASVEKGSYCTAPCRTAGFEDTIAASYKQNSGVPKVLICSFEAQAPSDARKRNFVRACVLLTDVYLHYYSHVLVSIFLKQSKCS